MTCKECPTIFLPGRNTQVFCSKICKQNWSSRDWRARNPERAKELDGRRTPEQIERGRAYVREWRARNKEHTKQKDAERWPGRREAENARRKDWYRANEEHSKEATKVIYRKARVDAPWLLLLYSAKGRAQKRKIPFGLTEEWATSTWTGRCALTGIPFDLGTGRHIERMRSPSIDKIHASLGYVPENCRFVLWAVNAFKGTGTDEAMFEIAKAMVGYNNS